MVCWLNYPDMLKSKRKNIERNYNSLRQNIFTLNLMTSEIWYDRGAGFKKFSYIFFTPVPVEWGYSSLTDSWIDLAWLF